MHLLFRLLSSCHSFRDLQQCRNNFTKPRLVLLKFSEDLHECFVLLVAFAIVQLVAFAKGGQSGTGISTIRTISISVREGLAVLMSESKRTGCKINVESYPFTIFYAAHYYMMVISAYLYAIYRCKRRSNFLYGLRE